MEKIVATACQNAGANYKFNYTKGYPAVINHPEETALLVQSATQVVGSEQTINIAPSMGAEDFAYYLQKVPGTYFFTGAGNEDKGIIYPHHHAKFDIDEEAMMIAAKVLLTAALNYLTQ